MAGATRLVAGASGTTPNGGVCFPGEFFIIAVAFSLGQDLNFGRLAYIADCYGELRPLDEATLVSNELLVSPPPPGLLGANLKVLAHQIQHSLGPNPTMLDRRQMFYMLANIPPPDCIWYYLPVAEPPKL